MEVRRAKPARKDPRLVDPGQSKSLSSVAVHFLYADQLQAKSRRSSAVRELSAPTRDKPVRSNHDDSPDERHDDALQVDAGHQVGAQHYCG